MTNKKRGGERFGSMVFHPPCTLFTVFEESILQEHIPEDKLKEVIRVFYGQQPQDRELEVSAEVSALASKHDFQVKAFKFFCPFEQLRAARTVKVGVIQNKIVRPTTDPLKEQVTPS